MSETTKNYLDKRDSLESEIGKMIANTLDKLEKVQCLDYFDIEIKVHQNKIDIRYIIKDKGKVS